MLLLDMLAMDDRELAHFYRDVLVSEIETTELLGCDVEVIDYEPVLQLKVTLRSPAYDEGLNGSACVLAFCIPKFYPAHLPTVEIMHTYNFPQGYKMQMCEEFEYIFESNVGGQLIMPLTTRALIMLHDLELPIEERQYNLTDM